MLQFIATDVIISKGPKDKPALRFSEDGSSSVLFRIGKRIYDKREEDNHRWVNINAKAFGSVCERINKMKLDAGSFVHIMGRYDEDVWTGEDEKLMRAPVIIIEHIEYSYSGNGKNKQSGDDNAAGSPESSPDASAPPQSPGEMQEFTGYTPFTEAPNTKNPFFPSQPLTQS